MSAATHVPESTLMDQVAVSCANLAGLLRELNRLAEATSYARRAMDIKMTTLSHDHPDLAGAQLWVAELLKDSAQ